jgi:hypothetical protein
MVPHQSPNCIKKKPKQIDIILQNVFDHHQLIITGGLWLFNIRKVISRNEDGNWIRAFAYERVDGLGFLTQVKVHDYVFKIIMVLLEEMHYGCVIAKIELKVVTCHK